ncbi:hypothetical protein H6F50_09325 [Coleofasciculus sp. FACHB-712]|uniref:hypothetical protein n=1 Tax=Cyanophyceae TaxID=3028117 RepID=UPI00168311AA|nr:hypothetical protein [Coleofasciculus sp. FACHB-712]MBD1942554.1 hypothetical protein [Coleofasciculus sp. FACHB-712]
MLGLWDRLIGPGATPAENILILTSAFVGAALAAFRLWLLGFGFLPIAVGAIIGFDIIGGAVCNATDTTKRWYHRPEVNSVEHITFILPHLLHIALAAWFFRVGVGFDWNYFTSVSACLLLATAVVLAVPVYLKRPLAVGLYLIAVAIGLYKVGFTPGLEWFIPALFLKLLIGHLVPERRKYSEGDTSRKVAIEMLIR